MSSGKFQTIWRIAVYLCAALAVFTVLFVSCTRAPEGSGSIRAAQTQTENTEAPETTGAPEETPEPVIVQPGAEA